MSLIKFNNDFFPSNWDNFFDNDWFGNPGKFQMGTKVPAVNILDNDDEYTVEMAAPGMKKEDFKIDLDNNLLAISVEKNYENTEEDKNGNYTRREFGYDSFRRVFALPESANEDEIKASYNNGILNIVVPKKEEAKPKPPRKIEIA
ncbi:Hsp20/alpha crystallin family protein [Aquimarina celericrescens]|uniref:Hsp20/alpha crystallin family protein n=1 Tax=Aquimarina celericrescens TaxID=1964542 RepID=A0ABW5B0D0_9FLAO|nr:Hsp20/alpha crystallin family protein [Aquimarina celericrescens]